jgi:hypothetical protein
MENDPLLFIQTVDDKKVSTSNQEYYDSRRSTKKKHCKYRLEDIRAMLFYRINILAEITTKNNYYEGIVTDVFSDGLIIQIDDKSITIPLIDVIEINILKA